MTDREQKIREMFYRKILPRLKQQDMTPADFYGIHREHNIQFIEKCLSALAELDKPTIIREEIIEDLAWKIHYKQCDSLGIPNAVNKVLSILTELDNDRIKDLEELAEERLQYAIKLEKELDKPISHTQIIKHLKGDPKFNKTLNDFREDRIGSGVVYSAIAISLDALLGKIKEPINSNLSHYEEFPKGECNFTICAVCNKPLIVGKSIQEWICEEHLFGKIKPEEPKTCQHEWNECIGAYRKCKKCFELQRTDTTLNPEKSQEIDYKKIILDTIIMWKQKSIEDEVNARNPDTNDTTH